MASSSSPNGTFQIVLTSRKQSLSTPPVPDRTPHAASSHFNSPSPSYDTLDKGHFSPEQSSVNPRNRILNHELRRSFEAQCFQMCLKGGIAADVRRELWTHTELKYSSSQTYQQFLERSGRDLDPAERLLIRSDARRYPEVLLTSTFDKRELDRETVSAQVERILLAACCRNMAPQMRYTQGMNYLAAMLVTQGGGLGEEEAFWTFCHLLENVLPKDFFAEYPRLQGFHVYAVVFSQLLIQRSLLTALTAQEIRNVASLLSFKWIMTGFVGEMPLDKLVRLWDALFSISASESFLMLLQVALACVELADDEVAETAAADPIMAYPTLLGYVSRLPVTIENLLQIALGFQLTAEAAQALRAAVKACIRKPSEVSRLTGVRSVSRGHFLVLKAELLKHTSERSKKRMVRAYSSNPPESDGQLPLRRSHTDTQPPPAPDAIGWEIFELTVKKIMPDWPQADARKLFKLFAGDSLKTVRCRDLLTAMSTICSGTLEQRLRLCFDLYVEKTSGKISHENLLSLSETLFLLLHTEDIRGSSKDTLLTQFTPPSQAPVLSAPSKRDVPAVDSSSVSLHLRSERLPPTSLQTLRGGRGTAHRFRKPKATLSSRNLLYWSSPAEQTVLGRQSLPILSPTDALVNYTSDAYSFVTKVAQMIKAEWITYEEWKQCMLTEQGLLQCFQLDSEYRVDTSKLDAVEDPPSQAERSSVHYPAARRQMIKSLIVEAIRFPSTRFAPSSAGSVAATSECTEEQGPSSKSALSGICSHCTIS